MTHGKAMKDVKIVALLLVTVVFNSTFLISCAHTSAGSVFVNDSAAPPQIGVRLRPVVTPVFVTQQLNEPSDVRIPVFQVVKVKPGLAAEKAGLLEGDQLVMIDQTRIRGMLSAVAEMHKRSPGEAVILTLVRNGRLMKLRVTLTQ